MAGTVSSQAGLAQRLGINRTVLTYLLDDLESAGLVTRRLDASDRRNRHVVATEKGRQLHDATAARLRSVEDEVLTALGPAEQETLRALLARVAGPPDGSDPLDGACEIVADLPSAQRRAQS